MYIVIHTKKSLIFFFVCSYVSYPFFRFRMLRFYCCWSAREYFSMNQLLCKHARIFTSTHTWNASIYFTRTKKNIRQMLTDKTEKKTNEARLRSCSMLESIQYEMKWSNIKCNKAKHHIELIIALWDRIAHIDRV